MFREYSSLRAKSVGPALYEEMTLDRPGGGKATVIIKGQNFVFNHSKAMNLKRFFKKNSNQIYLTSHGHNLSYEIRTFNFKLFRCRKLLSFYFYKQMTEYPFI